MRRYTYDFKKWLLVTLVVSVCVTVNAGATEHVVVRGDSIVGISLYYAVSPQALLKENGLTRSSVLRAGDVLRIPARLLGNARRTHRIERGDTLASIARKYKVPLAQLARLNRIRPGDLLTVGRTLAIPNPPGDPGPTPAQRRGMDETDDGDDFLESPTWAGGVTGLVKDGRIVDDGVMHRVQRNQSLEMIARAYNVTVTRLKRTNKISKKNPLIPGREIRIPDAIRPVPVRTSQYRPHRVTIIRVKNTRRLTLQLIGSNGRVIPSSRNRVGRLIGYKSIKTRLVSLMQRLAERFPGKAIRIYSGYRKHNIRQRRTRSYHSRNAAIDFTIDGVANDLVYEFVSALPRVGAGYYPNSVHIHLDVRDKKYLWTDVSKRGQKPRYVDDSHPGHFTNRQISIE